MLGVGLQDRNGHRMVTAEHDGYGASTEQCADDRGDPLQITGVVPWNEPDIARISEQDLPSREEVATKIDVQVPVIRLEGERSSAERGWCSR
jgi:hypothetical protein